MEKINKQLQIILKKNFSKVKIPKKKKLKAGDFEEWDSLGHLNFLLAVERHFKIKFSMEQMTELKDFDEISQSIVKIKKNEKH